VKRKRPRLTNWQLMMCEEKQWKFYLRVIREKMEKTISKRERETMEMMLYHI
jgi:hypothetical protein